MYTQRQGTAMGHVFAPPYACLVIGFLEEEILFKTELQRFFTPTDITIIQNGYKRYMDDGTAFIPEIVDCDTLLGCLNNLHEDINFTLEAAHFIERNNNQAQILNFLDINIALLENGNIETDVFYKPTNSHKYLNYQSFHPRHVKDNIPFNLAKRLIVFVTNCEKMEFRLTQLKAWLKKCGYPDKIVDKGFHNARLQGPAPVKTKNKDTLPFVTTYMCNYDCTSMINNVRNLISSNKSHTLKDILKNINVVVGFKQPANLKNILTRAKFETHQNNDERHPITPGIFKKCDSRCNLCHKDYLQECSSFKTSNGIIWEIKSNINCNSTNVIYYLKCNMCKGMVTYTGKTKTSLRIRTNNHISSCRNGTGSNIFDMHVYECGTRNKCLKPPYFQLLAFMKLSTEEKLLIYEKYLHRKCFDTMNC